VATWEDIRAVALGLPGVSEGESLGGRDFTVGTKGFVHNWRGRVVMKLDKGHQELLFEVRPETFSPMVAGALRWAWVEIDHLDPAELADLVREAWACVVPKKVSRAYSGAPQSTQRTRSDPPP